MIANLIDVSALIQDSLHAMGMFFVELLKTSPTLAIFLVLCVFAPPVKCFVKRRH